ncbi:MAG: hypothetical protein ACM3SS_01065 [Rhodospirillaceae bacterium]
MYTGLPVKRPNPHVRERYEFDFTCDGDWLYLDSFSDFNDERLQREKRLVSECGEQWRLIDAWSGSIVQEAPEVSFAQRLGRWLDGVASEFRRVGHRLLSQ